MSAVPAALPLIIGHRGASAAAPENTIAAFTRALSDGAEGIEFDVRLARDGVPVVIHDATLQRTAQMPGAVSDFTAAELGRIEVGSWFNHQHPDRARNEFQRETIPSLEQLFQSMAHTDAVLYLEMKSEENPAQALSFEVVKLIRQFGFADRVIVESFNLPTLALVKSLDAGIRLAALFESRLSHPFSVLKRLRMVSLARQVGASEIALHRSLVRAPIVARATSFDLPVVAWTVDHPNWIKRARSLGLRALITNDPYQMIQARSAHDSVKRAGLRKKENTRTIR